MLESAALLLAAWPPPGALKSVGGPKSDASVLLMAWPAWNDAQPQDIFV